MSKSGFSCSDCCTEGFDKHYSSLAALRKHRRKWHGDVLLHTSLSCPICPEIYSGNAPSLQIHYEIDHNLDLNKYEKEFSSMADFEKWKSDLELRTCSEFIKRRKAYTTSDGTKKLEFSCSRDGKYRSRGTGRRTPKIQGSKKINAHCPAGMKLCVSVDGALRVNVVETHVGHAVELGQVALTRVEREEVAKKIQSKVPFDAILEEFRKSGSNDRLTRINLLSRQDLYNIEKGFALSDKSVRQSSNGLESWVEQINAREPVVRYYKPKGEEAMDEYDLQSEHLILIFFDNTQVDILKRFSEKCICIDQISDSLAAILVVDDFNQVFPTAFLVSNRMDSTVLNLFFQTVKAAVGCSVNTELFISGTDETYYNIWSQVMVTPGMALYASWLVESDWRSHLVTIKDKPKQDEVYKILKAIAVEGNKDTFNSLFEEASQWLVEDAATREFGTYFIEKYGSSAMKWANCCRKSPAIPWTLQLERVHKTLQHIYSAGKTTEHPGKVVQSLMRFPRELLYDRLTRHEMVPSRLKHLEKLHKKVELLIGCTVVFEGNKWVFSLPNSSKVEKVSKYNLLCDCIGRCPVCRGCSHMYLCSCPESLVRWRMCEHIHYLCEYVVDGDREGATMANVDVLERVPLDGVSQTSKNPYKEEMTLAVFDVPSKDHAIDDLVSENDGQAVHTKENLHEYKLRVNNTLRTVVDLVNQAVSLEEVQMYENLIKPVLTSLEARGYFNNPSRPHTEVSADLPNNQEMSSNSVRKMRKVDNNTEECFFDCSSTILVVQESAVDGVPEELLASKKVENVEIVFKSDEEFGYAEEITLM